MQGQKLWLGYIKPFTGEHFQDTYANTVAIVNPSADIKIVLEAHADEISWLVNYIDEKEKEVYNIKGTDPSPSKFARNFAAGFIGAVLSPTDFS